MEHISKVTLSKITHARGKQAIVQPLVAKLLKAKKWKAEDLLMGHKADSERKEDFAVLHAAVTEKLGWTAKQKSLANNYVNLSLERIMYGYKTKEEVKAEAEAAAAKALAAEAAKSTKAEETTK